MAEVPWPWPWAGMTPGPESLGPGVPVAGGPLALVALALALVVLVSSCCLHSRSRSRSSCDQLVRVYYPFVVRCPRATRPRCMSAEPKPRQRQTNAIHRRLEWRKKSVAVF